MTTSQINYDIAQFAIDQFNRTTSIAEQITNFVLNNDMDYDDNIDNHICDLYHQCLNNFKTVSSWLDINSDKPSNYDEFKKCYSEITAIVHYMDCEEEELPAAMATLADLAIAEHRAGETLPMTFPISKHE